MVLVSPAFLQAQFTSIDNNSGLWTDNATWVGGVAPGVAGITDEINIYGNVLRQGSLGYTSNTLHVYDTLIITGDVFFTPFVDLIVESGGVLIIYGDFLGLAPDISNEGTIAVLGSFNIIDLFPPPFTAGEFENIGNLFIPNPGIIPPWPTYDDLDCPDPDDYPANCGYGNQDDLEDDPIWDLIEDGGYEIEPAGPIDLCEGNSISLSIREGGDAYQWFRDGVPIPGATGRVYDASQSGDYSAQVTVGADTYDLNTVTVTVIPTPATGIISSTGALTRR